MYVRYKSEYMYSQLFGGGGHSTTYCTQKLHNHCDALKTLGIIGSIGHKDGSQTERLSAPQRLSPPIDGGQMVMSFNKLVMLQCDCLIWKNPHCHVHASIFLCLGCYFQLENTFTFALTYLRGNGIGQKLAACPNPKHVEPCAISRHHDPIKLSIICGSPNSHWKKEQLNYRFSRTPRTTCISSHILYKNHTRKSCGSMSLN